MAKKDTWMPFDVGAYLSDTMRLTTQQHGAYLLLLLDYWKTGPLPDDDSLLAGITKVELKEWKSKVGPAVRRFFTLGGDGLLHQKRADAEIEKTGRISAARRNAAFERHGIQPHPPPNDMQTGCKPDANALQTNGNSDANEEQNSLRARPVRGHAVAPPIPRTNTSQAASVTQSPRDPSPAANGHHPPPGQPEATEQNGWTGWHDGREYVGSIEWKPAWEAIIEAARIDLTRWTGTEIPARRWLMEIRDSQPIVSAIRRVAERDGYTPPGSLAYFDKPVRDAAAKATA